MNYGTGWLFLIAVLFSCGSASNPSFSNEQKEHVAVSPIDFSTLDIQGHRGCRGLMPENTMPGFKKALELGVKTLELDVVITSDNMVICSHEPWFSHEIALDPQGRDIPVIQEKNHAIFQMTYKQTQLYDVGMKIHPRFPAQLKMPVTKPLLSDVIDACDRYAASLDRPLPFYNIETKSLPEGDEIFHPAPAEFCEILIQTVIQADVIERVIIQSFDVRTLQYIHQKYPKIALALLVENDWGMKKNISELGFFPAIYSPDFSLVDDKLIRYCSDHSMKCVPWTLNEIPEFVEAVKLQVDGIITDYPDRILALRATK